VKGKGREKEGNRKGIGKEKGNDRRATRDSWRVWTMAPMEIDGFRNHSQGIRKRLFTSVLNYGILFNIKRVAFKITL
jgi:hypothetical protein